MFGEDHNPPHFHVRYICIMMN
ncbi:MAG: hypothetical protein II939_16560 [Bacteroidales bacterium]|nr:hypothetical protein [Bacteroidales bacterium]